MTTLLILGMVLGLSAGSAGQSPDHTLLTQVLAEHVRDGVVDYGRMTNDARLGRYIDGIAGIDPDSIADRDSRLAFWINVYNAVTLKLICDNYPVASINDLHTGGLVIGTVFKSTAWDREIIRLKGKTLTLNQVEHDIIRPGFKDPRAHFALVCASKSCPQLRGEAFEGARLDDQLDDQARRFLADPFRNSFDRASRIAHLSKIFDWYGSDFGDSETAVLVWMTRFMEAPSGKSILDDSSAWDVEYKEYDWSLNGH